MLERLQGVYQAAGALAWSVVLALRWIHAQFVAPAGAFLSDTLLPVYEESVKVGGGPLGCSADLAAWLRAAQQRARSLHAHVRGPAMPRAARRLPCRC